MKSARRRIDVNLDELDQVLDGAKTSAVLENSEGSETGTGIQPDTNPPPSSGHGRNGAEAFDGARKVSVAHQKLTHGDRCPECGGGDDRATQVRQWGPVLPFGTRGSDVQRRHQHEGAAAGTRAR